MFYIKKSVFRSHCLLILSSFFTVFFTLFFSIGNSRLRSAKHEKIVRRNPRTRDISRIPGFKRILASFVYLSGYHFIVSDFLSLFPNIRFVSNGMSNGKIVGKQKNLAKKFRSAESRQEIQEIRKPCLISRIV